MISSILGRLLKEKQSLLVRKHETARQRVDNVNVGGGVSLWPEMESMRLTEEEIIQLAALCVGLLAFVIAVFYYLHGIICFVTNIKFLFFSFAAKQEILGKL